MTNPDLLLSMTEAEIGREIIRLVPHWYEAPYGPEQYRFRWAATRPDSATIAA